MYPYSPCPNNNLNLCSLDRESSRPLRFKDFLNNWLQNSRVENDDSFLKEAWVFIALPFAKRKTHTHTHTHYWNYVIHLRTRVILKEVKSIQELMEDHPWNVSKYEYYHYLNYK
jgi:hypothetical protein